MGESSLGITNRTLSALVVSAFLVAGCLSKEEAASIDSGTNNPPIGGNSAPTISGNPPVTVEAGVNYSFTPTASDPDGDTLTFEIVNRPNWASFNSSTGVLTGTPTLGAVGMYNQIRISVTDGQASSSLPQFGVEVTNTTVVTGMAVSGTQPNDTIVADVGSAIRVNFNSEVDPAFVVSDSVTVSDRNGPVNGTISVEGNSIVFTPSANMATGMLHSVQVSSAVRNTNGDTLGTAYSWSFTTSFGDAIPELATLETAMRNQGPYWGNYMDPAGPNNQKDKFFHEFYSSANSFHQISDYLGETEPWLTYADWSNEVFRTYLISTGYSTQGYRRFTHGMYGERVRRNNVTLEELEMLRDIPAFSRVAEGRGRGGGEHRSREVALALVANVHAERAGSTRVMENGAPRFQTFIPWMGSHLYEWRTGDYVNPPDGYSSRFAPFMFGITAHALIEYIEWEREIGNDPNQYWLVEYPMDYGSGTTPGATTVQWPTIVDALADVATWAVVEARHELGDPMWVPDSRGYATFLYEDINSVRIATDLNLMIAPAYAWLWKETGNRQFRDWADQLFGAGALRSPQSATGSGKHFNQQFFNSFDYIRWRAEGDERWSQN